MKNYPTGVFVALVGFIVGATFLGLDLLVFGEVHFVAVPIVGFVVFVLGLIQAFVRTSDSGITWYGPNGEVEEMRLLETIKQAGEVESVGYAYTYDPSAPYDPSSGVLFIGKPTTRRWKFIAAPGNTINFRRIRKEAFETARELGKRVTRIEVGTAFDGWRGRDILGTWDELDFDPERDAPELDDGRVRFGWDMDTSWQRYRGRVHVTVFMKPRALLLKTEPKSEAA